jgi:hypothetical protein
MGEAQTDLIQEPHLHTSVEQEAITRLVVVVAREVRAYLRLLQMAIRGPRALPAVVVVPAAAHKPHVQPARNWVVQAERVAVGQSLTPLMVPAVVVEAVV